jgi:hypothetical protein
MICETVRYKGRAGEDSKLERKRGVKRILRNVIRTEGSKRMKRQESADESKGLLL